MLVQVKFLQQIFICLGKDDIFLKKLFFLVLTIEVSETTFRLKKFGGQY